MTPPPAGVAHDPEKLEPGKFSTMRVTVKECWGLTERVRQGYLGPVSSF